MGTFVLGYSDKALDATYSGGTWATNLGLEQFNVSYTTAVARTTTDAVLSLDVTILDLIDIGCVGILNHNLTSAATMQWEFFSEVGRTTLVHDTGSITIGSFSPELLTKNSLTTIPNISEYYITLTITDTLNPDNYLEIGGLFIGKRLSSSCNIDYGLTHGVEDSSPTMLSDHGVAHHIQIPVKRTAAFGLSLIDYDEGDAAFKMMLETGVTKRVFYQFDEDDSKLGIYTYVAELSKMSPLQYPSYNINDVNFSIKELT